MSRDTDEPWTHEQAIVNGVRLHYVTAGEGPLVVLLHGFPEFWYSWREQIPALADAGYRVVAPDMRGYNTSEKPSGVGAYRVETLVEDVLALADHVAETDDKPVVVGHDWGGVVAWELAMRHPDALDKLVVLNAPHPELYRQEILRNPRQLKKSWYAGFFQLPKLPEWFLSARDYAAVEDLFREGATNPAAFTERDIRRYRDAISKPGALTAAVNYYRALFREELARQFLGGGDLQTFDVLVPTLLVWGEQDDALTVELTEGLDVWVPDIRVERLPEASHWVQNDAPDDVNDLLVAFLGA